MQQKIKWYNWDKESFEIAQKQNKPLFIFVKYDTCYWCKKMIDEVLLDPKSISMLNENFISIMIDRVEAPDLDKYYQNIYKLLNNAPGGWPLSIFCTPDNIPFFAGSYIPMESEQGSVEGMGFEELTQLINHKVKHNDPKLTENAQEVALFLNKSPHPTQATHLKEELYKVFVAQARDNYDTRNGGFSKAPKFPHATLLLTLMSIDTLYDERSVAPMVQTTLTAMQESALFDTIEGGFFRYAQQQNWSDPYKEKTLYDNATLLSLYTQAYTLYNEPSYLQTAKKTADFILDTLQNNHLFYTAQSMEFDTKEVVFDTHTTIAYSSLMVTALYHLAHYEPKYATYATQTLQKLIEIVEQKDIQTLFLDDFAALAQALLFGFEATKDEIYLIKAQHIINKALELLYVHGGWKISTKEIEVYADATDTISISAVSIMIANMRTLATILNDEKYNVFAFKTLEYNSYALAHEPLRYPSLMKEMLLYKSSSSSTAL